MRTLLDHYYRFLKIALTFLMGLMLIPVLMQIVSRHTGIVPRYVWTEEAARFCFVWIIMLGSVIAVRDGTHFCVDLLPHPSTPRRQALSSIIVHGAMLVLALFFAWYGFHFAKFGWRQTSEMSGINMLSIYIAFPLAGVSWVLFLSDKIARDYKLFQVTKGQPDERT